MKRADLLDHGYVELVESWGSDQRVVESARMSTQKGFLGWGPSCSKCGIQMVEVSGGGWSAADYERGEQKGCEHDAGKPGDEKLLKYLWDNAHATPFEFAGMTIEVQAPIFVFREWHRHRVPFGYNEASARYAPLPDLNYIPTVERLMVNAGGANKQAGTVVGAEVLDEEGAREYRKMLEYTYAHAEQVYQSALKKGVPKELARIHLPVGRYSKMRATANLRGWLGFCKLRQASTAQYEIRVYADAVGAILREAFPRTYALFEGR